jgi:hypothetical protein
MEYRLEGTKIASNIMKFSRVISRVRWFGLVETNVSKTISVLGLRVVEDKDRDGL